MKKENIDMKKEITRLKKSFPQIIESEIDGLLSLITINYDYDVSWAWGYCMIIENQRIEIPGRIYWEEHRLKEPRNLSSIQRHVLDCLLTRHHNGYVREKYLNRIISNNRYWVMPYLVQLMGEYVIEILELIWNKFESINKTNLIRFIHENQEYWDRTKQRIVSYWDCYYRYKGKEDYVGYKLINEIEELINNN